jgi:hypothetical protein
MSGSSSAPYSPKCLEKEEFSEVQGSNLLRVVRSEGTPGPPQRPFRARRAGDRHARGEDLCRAVATCYFPKCARISALSRVRHPLADLGYAALSRSNTYSLLVLAHCD